MPTMSVYHTLKLLCDMSLIHACLIPFTVVVRAQRFPRVPYVIQAAPERPGSLPEEALEAPCAGRSAADQEHDREALGNHLHPQEVRRHLRLFALE